MIHQSLHGSCHCGALRWRLGRLPAQATECNCSICHRLGAIWAYGRLDEVALIAAPAALHRYRHGDETLEFCSCRHCGCTTHWQGRSAGDDEILRVGLNLRMAPAAALDAVTIRRFDGADSWQFLD